MKYLRESFTDTGAWRWVIAEALLSILYNVINALILKWIADVMATGALVTCMWIAAACVINTMMNGVIGYAGISRHKSFTDLNNKFVSKLVNSDVELFSKHSPGTIIDTGGKLFQLTMAARIAIGIVRSVGLVVINIVMITTIAGWRMSLPVIGIEAILAILIFFQNKRWNKIDEAVDEIIRKRNNEMDELANGFMECRSFSGVGKRHVANVRAINEEIMEKFKSRQFITFAMNAIVDTADSAATLVAIYYVLAINTGFEPALGLALVMYVWRLCEPTFHIAASISDLSEVLSVLPKFEEIMGYENQIEDGSIELNDFHGGIEFQNVSFKYPKSEMVLTNINMTIPKSAHVGICGATGSGKTTLSRLIPRFYDPTYGKVMIDGIDLRQYTMESIRHHIGIVHQSIHIFNGTLRQNIEYGRLDNVPDNELEEACRKAGLMDFVESLPERFDTKVGPRGLKLSGGQRQRISLARVFLTKPDIIIFDEATSALDNETEEAVQRAVDALDGITTITIAHRLTTIRNCDCIYVMDQHRIAESGTHDELLAQGGIYARMVR